MSDENFSVECPCCGDLAAEEGSYVYDGQKSLCGCPGHWYVDSESVFFDLDEDVPCPVCDKGRG